MDCGLLELTKMEFQILDPEGCTDIEVLTDSHLCLALSDFGKL